MHENLVHLGTVGSRDGWDIDVQLTLARDLETWEPVWIRPAPASELPGDGWRFVADIPVGGVFQPSGLKEIDEFDGIPVCVLEDAQQTNEELLTFTEGRAPWNILSPANPSQPAHPIILEEVLARRPDEATESPWSVPFRARPHPSPDVGPDDVLFCGEVTVVPGQAPPRRLRQVSTVSFNGHHTEEEARTWPELRKGEFETSLVEYRNAEVEAGPPSDRDLSNYTALGKRCIDPAYPEHVIVHNSAAAPYYFVIALSEELIDGGFLDEFLEEDYINELKETPTAR